MLQKQNLTMKFNQITMKTIYLLVTGKGLAVSKMY